MPSNLITVQIGQCGNQIGVEFWKTMCEEHGIGPTGMPTSEDRPGQDQKAVHFYETEGSRYMPRSVLIDLEPRVVNLILNSEHGRLYNMENVFHSKSGGGAGNNWASGYNQSEEIVDEIFEILRREAENADALEGFVLCHSISGGTGSGLGSKVLEQLRQRTIIQSYSAFSNLGGDASDVVVGPYNSILTLDWLMENTDLVVALDNKALYKVAIETMREKQPSFEHINSMISRIIAGVTAPMRFYSPIYTRLSHIAGYLNPFPPMQFIQTAYSPFAPANNQFVINTTPSTILSRILEPKSLISSANLCQSFSSRKSVTDEGSRGPTPPSQLNHCMLSGLAVLRSDGTEKAGDKITDSNVGGALRKLRGKSNNKNIITYPPWSSSTLHITTTKLSPYVQHRHHTSGLLLANHTNMSNVFQQITHHYDAMRRRKAYINTFEREGHDTLELMNQSREKVEQLIHLYEEATTMNFMEDMKEYQPPPVLNDNPLFSNILSSSNVQVERGGQAESSC